MAIDARFPDRVRIRFGITASTFDSFRTTRVGSDLYKAYRSLVKQLKKNRVSALVIDEYGELPVYHLEILLRLSKSDKALGWSGIPLYIFGDHDKPSL